MFPKTPMTFWVVLGMKKNKELKGKILNMEPKTKKLIIKTVVIIALIIAVTVICTNVINAMAFRHTEGLVYRTKTGDCYHAPGCGYLWNSAIPMGYEQAKASSLRMCSRCGGEPKGTIVVDEYGKAFAITLLVEMGVAFLVLFIRYKLYSETEPQVQTYVPPTKPIDMPPKDPPKPIIPIRKGSIVRHPKWGAGEVTLIEGGYITIWFCSPEFKTHNEGIKKFQYPDAVGKFFDVIEY